ncbi:acrylate utilization transcriptional regulator AcuR [Pseudodonghicola flavimaris]|uniref:TetR/AcrR family transcriptional regulator n=1 Tax=Pseudodonghicola flavimaris TaxID=3050036 RepID=A0ABT7F4R5_9RHOB|nr:TetR/AcrR family transcriptional regulator [Pseudodonghicola flavimaris]MDK3019599.1 TetR/AcrR family transcriptional regulator [Pseudodonghicola flavimaris]
MTRTEAAPRKRGRPRKTEAELTETRGRLIRAGVATLTEKGFSAVGIEEILQAAAMPKGSFYYYFASKEAFGLELIAAYAGYFARKLDRWFLDETVQPLQRLVNFTEDARDGMARHGFARGCLVGNLGQEMGTLPESFRAALMQVFDDWQARTAACLRRAQAAGEIAAGRDCDELAAVFWIGWEGAVLRAKLERRAAPLEIFARGYFAGLTGNAP